MFRVRVKNSANRFKGHLEYSVVPSVPLQVFYIKYIDECMVKSKTGEDYKILLNKLNKLHTMILQKWM